MLGEHNLPMLDLPFTWDPPSSEFLEFLRSFEYASLQERIENLDCEE